MILGSQTWDPDPETPCGTGMRVPWCSAGGSQAEWPHPHQKTLFLGVCATVKAVMSQEV